MNRTDGSSGAVTYALVTFGLSWGAWCLAVAFGQGFQSMWTKALLFLGLLGPPLGAWTAVRLHHDAAERVDLLRRLVRLRSQPSPLSHEAAAA